MWSSAWHDFSLPRGNDSLCQSVQLYFLVGKPSGNATRHGYGQWCLLTACSREPADNPLKRSVQRMYNNQHYVSRYHGHRQLASSRSLLYAGTGSSPLPLKRPWSEAPSQGAPPANKLQANPRAAQAQPELPPRRKELGEAAVSITSGNCSITAGEANVCRPGKTVDPAPWA